MKKTEKLEETKVYLNKGNQLRKEGQLAQAVEQYFAALNIDPDYVPALNQLAAICTDKGECNKAIAFYEQVGKLQPNDSLTHANLARVLMIQGNIGEAIISFKKAITLQSELPAWVYHEFGDVLKANGQSDEALAAYLKALESKPLRPALISQKIENCKRENGLNPLQAIAKLIQKEAPFTGGPIGSFEEVGRDTLITLLQNGLRPDQTILDFGCGALRLGYWLVRFMDEGKYYGIEPSEEMLETGKKYSLGEKVLSLKKPNFSLDASCDFSVFGVQFNFVVARSILTHTSPAMLRKIIKSFKENGTENSVMLASYWPIEASQNGEFGDKLDLDDWRFMFAVKYSLGTIRSWAKEFGINVYEFRSNAPINEQIWLKFEQKIGSVSDLDTVIRNPADLQHVKATYIHIWNITQRLFRTYLASLRVIRKKEDSVSSDPPQARHQIAYEPDLVPPPDLMRQEGVNVLEEWFRWAENWSLLLRIYGGMARNNAVLEIGCGLGRTAFPLRHALSAQGSYDGFEICQYKVAFLERTFHRLHPNFHFVWADIHNTFYNPQGQIKPIDYRFPYSDATFDIVYAASVFTHMLPETAAHYFRETARVLKPGGRCVFSFFLLDNYQPAQPRPSGFAGPAFNFDHTYGGYGDDFAIVAPDNPEQMTAYRLNLIDRFAAQAQLKLAQAPLPGLWSGTTETWVGAQDLLVLVKS